jgi:hypothetical protein
VKYFHYLIITAISCLAGSYLPLGETQCKECPAGTFSLGGGHKILTFDPLPTRFLDFSTWCEDYFSKEKLPSNECSGYLTLALSINYKDGKDMRTT